METSDGGNRSALLRVIMSQLIEVAQYGLYRPCEPFLYFEDFDVFNATSSACPDDREARIYPSSPAVKMAPACEVINRAKAGTILDIPHRL